MAHKLTHLSAVELARLVRTKEASPVEVVEAHLAAIQKINPAVNAFCTVAAEKALVWARDAERAVKKNAKLKPLHGVPVAIKDLTLTAGIRTTFGSTLFRDHVPTEDAEVVRRLKAAGAIVLGKTNTPEFGAGANTVNKVFGATRNPWNTALSASGSTGGGAASVAAPHACAVEERARCGRKSEEPEGPAPRLRARHRRNRRRRGDRAHLPHRGARSARRRRRGARGDRIQPRGRARRVSRAARRGDGGQSFRSPRAHRRARRQPRRQHPRGARAHLERDRARRAQARRDLAPLARPFRALRRTPHADRSGCAVSGGKELPRGGRGPEDAELHRLDRPDVPRVARSAARGERARGAHRREAPGGTADRRPEIFRADDPLDRE